MNKKRVALRGLLGLVVITLGAAFFSSRVAGQGDAWQVMRADYGWRDQRSDVTNLLRDLLAQGGVNGRIAVSNQAMGGDPAVGKDKNLRIFARNRNGEEREFDYKEGGFIDAAMFRFRTNSDWDDRPREADRSDRPRDAGRDASDFFIIRGYYGIHRRTANVTDILRTMVRDGSLTVRINNDSLGGDPAVGADKILVVIYRFQGKEQVVVLGEGNTLSIP